MFDDKALTCRDCGVSFTFTTGEQEFFQSRGFTNEPVSRAAARTVASLGRAKSDVVAVATVRAVTTGSRARPYTDESVSCLL